MYDRYREIFLVHRFINSPRGEKSPEHVARRSSIFGGEIEV
jgi:hypothetical protein